MFPHDLFRRMEILNAEKMCPFSSKVAVAGVMGCTSPRPVSSQILFFYACIEMSAMFSMLVLGSLLGLLTSLSDSDSGLVTRFLFVRRLSKAFEGSFISGILFMKG